MFYGKATRKTYIFYHYHKMLLLEDTNISILHLLFKVAMGKGCFETTSFTIGASGNLRIFWENVETV